MNRSEARLGRCRARAVGRMLGGLLLASLGAGLLVACGAAQTAVAPTPSPTTAPKPETLVFGDWPGYTPQSILDEFTQETGIQVTYRAYDTQEAAEADIRAGHVYDVVVMGNDFIPALLADGLLAEIDYRNVPNFKDVSANFRDLAYDPGNKHSIVYEWGTTGLLVRNDIVGPPVRRWADLWDARFAGKVGVSALPRYLMGIALKSLGYSINSENPAELEAALNRLLELRHNAFLIDLDLPSSVPFLVTGQAVLSYGWGYDILDARQQNAPVTYVLPDEGTLLWGDNLVIPADTRHKAAAERFLNFVLRADIGVQIVEEVLTATPNDAARALIDPKILNDSAVFPPDDALARAEIIMPLSPSGKAAYDALWERFLAAKP